MAGREVSCINKFTRECQDLNLRPLQQPQQHIKRRAVHEQLSRKFIDMASDRRHDNKWVSWKRAGRAKDTESLLIHFILSIMSIFKFLLFGFSIVLQIVCKSIKRDSHELEFTKCKIGARQSLEDHHDRLRRHSRLAVLACVFWSRPSIWHTANKPKNCLILVLIRSAREHGNVAFRKWKIKRILARWMCLNAEVEETSRCECLKNGTAESN
jgi:hypothetical protein